MVTAISEGRRSSTTWSRHPLYHLDPHPKIILTASLPLVLRMDLSEYFPPIHVIFLELIMGPTCSIFFENEPVESNLMDMPPREGTQGLHLGRIKLIGIAGLTITGGVLTLYYVFMRQPVQSKIPATLSSPPDPGNVS